MGSCVRGFTLMELLIVVVLVGILAAVGYPAMTKAMERAYWRAAQDVLKTIYAGERTYFFANNAYYNVDESVAGMTEWRKIYTDDPNLGSIPVKYCVTAAAATTFTAWACRSSTACSAGCGAEKGISVNEVRTIDTSDWPMP